MTRYVNIQTAGYDPTLPTSQRIVGMKQNALQNTLEQTVIHIAVTMALCTYLEGDKLKFIPMLVFLFLCGRVIFYIGYFATDNSLNRALGFVLTFLPNVAATVYCVYCLFTSGAGLGLPSQ